ncbi:MAG: serine--tRNA ligase [Alphaproteobacteria bacterium]|nr:serine--tRNA ligase [Alphaproteobacteria bacterium]
MHDIRLIRDDPEAFDAALARRGLPPRSQSLLEIDAALRETLTALQAAQARRNEASKDIGKAKAAKDEARAESLMAEVARLKTDIQEGEERERRLKAGLDAALSEIPNLPRAEVPDGPDESANVERHRVGTPRRFAFEPRDHVALGEPLGMDFEAAARMSGARFVALRGQLARLERALGAFMLDIHTREFGFEEVAPPVLVRSEAMFGTAQLPKFAEDQYAAGGDVWLVPTAEVPLTNLVREQILSEEVLPLRVTAFTPCFRQEAGAAGRDTRGMIRMHQFSKVELVSITTPERASHEHEHMLAAAETVLKRLDLPYRVMTLCTGDMGFASEKTYDIEVWLPGQDRYREISSVSVCGDFQARRMNARYRPAEGKGTRFLHTLNGSGLAVGRTLVALLENYQEADGSVTLPEAIRPYMGGLDRLVPKETRS